MKRTAHLAALETIDGSAAHAADAGLCERRRGSLEPDTGEAVEAYELDQGHDLRLRPAEPDRPVADAQAARQDRQVEHQRGVGERELGEVDHDVRLGANRPCERAAPDALRGPVLVAAAAVCGGVFIESDDPRNLPNSMVLVQAVTVLSLGADGCL
jgi:hypothetical protein